MNSVLWKQMRLERIETPTMDFYNIIINLETLN